MSRVIAVCFLVASAIWSTSNAFAQDASLYKAAPPPDSAFVRVVNARASDKPMNADIAGIRVKNIAASEISAYRIVKQGERSIKAGKATQPLTVEAGKFYTISVGGKAGAEEMSVLVDKPNKSRSKVGVYFYNLSDAPAASLVVPGKDVTILGDVVHGESNMRKVNAITVDLAVTVGDRTIAEFPQTSLKRQSSVSIALVGSGENLSAVFVENTMVQ